jgi:UDP-N-acetylmuramyl pentapeptide phosphotransferase/UDP-N-acetylglucosamine-1-phosphate transferase
MISLILIFSITFAASWVLTLIVRAAALRFGIVDRPDGQRKLHNGIKPLGGGVAVYLSMILGLLAANYLTHGSQKNLWELSLVVIFAGSFVCFFGLIDDIYRLNARFKLAMQICGVLPIALAGYSIDKVVAFGYRIELGPLAIPITVLWLIGCINALNLIDGMDGLASVVGLSTAAMLGLIAASEGHAHVSIIALILSSALAGFLVLNRPPASIFLGDSGSMVIGLIVGVLGMQGSLKTSATLSITAPAVVMILPMFDTIAAVIRRELTGRRFYSPDHEHIHHLLLARGLTPWQVLCILGALCLTTGAAATAATIFRKDALAWITAMVLIVTMIRMKLFGHREFSLLRETVLRKFLVFTRFLHPTRRPENPNFAEHSAITLETAWQTLVTEIKPWNIRRLELTIRRGPITGRRYWIDPAINKTQKCRWSVAVSIGRRDDRLCELTADGLEKPGEQDQLIGLTDMLKAFGNRLCEQSDDAEVLPFLTEIRTLSPEPSEERKKAA